MWFGIRSEIYAHTAKHREGHDRALEPIVDSRVVATRSRRYAGSIHAGGIIVDAKRATSVASGFFQNIGQTRREGFEASLNYQSPRWSTYVNYSYIDALMLRPGV
jgi:TonB dependent receptor